MSRDDLVQFARRDWTALAAAKQQHWLRRRLTTSPLEVLQASDDMRRHGRAIRPEGPSLADRMADLEIHHRVGCALRVVTSSTR
ncbi:MAG: hypothetical protein KA205_08710 [Acidobacteria bacterium]|nr:hypothetical protein [Acidobacteriota bacterium]